MYILLPTTFAIPSHYAFMRNDFPITHWSAHAQLPFPLSFGFSKGPSVVSTHNVVVVWFSKFNTANHWLQNSYHPSFTSSPIAPDISSNAHQTEFPLSSEGPCFQPIPSAIPTHNTSLHAVYHQYFNACDQNSGGEGSNVP